MNNSTNMNHNLFKVNKKNPEINGMSVFSEH